MIFAGIAKIAFVFLTACYLTTGVSGISCVGILDCPGSLDCVNNVCTECTLCMDAPTVTKPCCSSCSYDASQNLCR
ncbi:hypothetical protein BD560DRAFT_406521 [Blakeslea trispora]|nr:hypothetical protein BD560DRAFT_406521 [Blakeslea trispora]